MQIKKLFSKRLKRLRKILNAVIWFLAGTYLTLVILLNIHAVQSFIGSQVASALSDKLGTEVSVGRIDLGMLNRFILDDVHIKDKQNVEMLNAPRLSVKIDILDLLQGRININSAQIFGMKAKLYKSSVNSQTNFQFIIDSLSNDNGEKKPLDLEISSLVIRRGQLSWDIHDKEKKQQFDINHIGISDISAHVILNTLTNDSINLNIKRLSALEHSGISLKRLSLKVTGGWNALQIKDVLLEMPSTHMDISFINASYAFIEDKIKEGSLDFNGKINDSYITPYDLRGLLPQLSNITERINLSSEFQGTDKSINVESIDINNGKNTIFSGNILAELSQGNDYSWSLNIDDFHTNQEDLADITKQLGIANIIPEQIANLGTMKLQAKANGAKKMINISGNLTTDLGDAEIITSLKDNIFTANAEIGEFNIGKLITNEQLGNIAGIINTQGTLTNNKIDAVTAKADISRFEFNGYAFNNIHADADIKQGKTLAANVNINDNNGIIDINLSSDISEQLPHTVMNATVRDFAPMAMNLTNKLSNKTYNAELYADIIGNGIDNATGKVTLNNLKVESDDINYQLNTCEIKKNKVEYGEQIRMASDFGNILVEGNFDYKTIMASITNAIYDRLPTFPGIKKSAPTNNIINIYATLKKSDWLQELLRIPLELNEPMHLVANIDDTKKKFELNIDADNFRFNGSQYRNGFVIITSPDDILKGKMSVETEGVKGNTAAYSINASAGNNHLKTSLDLLINGKQTIMGVLNSDANFYENKNGDAVADISIMPSELLMNDTIWNINQSCLLYYNKHLEIDNFIVKHGNQHIAINGIATDTDNEELTIDINDVDVSYILDLVNFHAVNFSGYASGKIKANSLFSKPKANADLIVRDFRFENGRIGELLANGYWNIDEGRINIDAEAIDEGRKTIVTGYISPKDNDIDLNVTAQGTRLEFLERFCGSFLNDIDLNGWGNVNIVGPLKAINLVGDVDASGTLGLLPTQTNYKLDNIHVKLVPNDIILQNDSIYDRFGSMAIVNGHIRHKNLGQITYDINVDANNILGFETHDFGDDVFYGTVFATGSCRIKGKPGETTIDINATPNKGTVFVYNASSPDAIHNKDFIEWNDRNASAISYNTTEDKATEASTTKAKELRSNLYMNLMIHSNPDATLKILMDQNSGDCISLNGSGTIRGSYYNKGAFDLFGNYVVDHGTYTMTIQNVIKRNFEFLQGGTIAFGGDAYNAALNLQAQYTVNGVSLSDINIGRSFANNNVRVDCLMNITGTPGQPAVDFSLDLPTVSSDAKQMVMSLMNSEEEMNQQVLYLLAVGRFLNQGNNNSYLGDAAQQSQTSLAMQSILSGTISQQLSNMMDNIVDNNNWNIGANISTGDEGFNNAEYEGLLSGRMLNNRLLFNGQFGYRDNQNATSSFIGDFDLRYLLVPNGNAALKVYNQTNDKYFTKNSLNTQGVGIILKKDFNSWRDLFFRRKKNPTIR